MLPKIEYPIHSIKIPSSKKKIKFRPYLVKEEKLFLMAKESGNNNDILSTIKQVINNCCLESSFNINSLTIFDLEYIFLKLRSISVDNVVKLSYRDLEDERLYEFEIDLNDIEVIFPENIDNNIKITEESGILMKYPSASLYDDKEFLNLEKDQYFELIIRCIDKIYYQDEIFEVSNYNKKEIEEFLENLSIKTFEEIQKFLINSPKIIHNIEYTNSLGNKRSITLDSLNDFFQWR